MVCKNFDLPEEKDFKTEGLVVAVGCFDESNEVYINGKLIGSNGINLTMRVSASMTDPIRGM